jgi:hypothetical protein
MASEDPGGLISAAIGAFNEGKTADAQALALVAIATAINQLAIAVDNAQVA